MTAAIDLENLTAGSALRNGATSSGARGLGAGASGQPASSFVVVQDQSFRSSWQTLLGAVASDGKLELAVDGGRTGAPDGHVRTHPTSRILDMLSAPAYLGADALELAQGTPVATADATKVLLKMSADNSAIHAKQKAMVKSSVETQAPHETAPIAREEAGGTAVREVKKHSNAASDSDPAHSISLGANEQILNRLGIQPELTLPLSESVSRQITPVEIKGLPESMSGTVREPLVAASSLLPTAPGVTKNGIPDATIIAGQTGSSISTPVLETSRQTQAPDMALQASSATGAPTADARRDYVATHAAITSTPLQIPSPGSGTPVTAAGTVRPRAATASTEAKSAERLTALTETSVAQRGNTHAVSEHDSRAQASLTPAFSGARQDVDSSINRDSWPVPAAMGPGMSDAHKTTSNGQLSIAAQTLNALDAETSPVTPTWVRAGAHQVEAGFQDPALGWVAVRAQADSSGVHAALVASSADAAQSLGGHLEGLNAYLANHHTTVDSVTTAAPENQWARNGMDGDAQQGMHQGMHSGASQQDAQAEQQSGQGDQLSESASYLDADTLTTGRALRSADHLTAANTRAAYFAEGSRYISVVA